MIRVIVANSPVISSQAPAQAHWLYSKCLEPTGSLVKFSKEIRLEQLYVHGPMPK